MGREDYWTIIGPIIVKEQVHFDWKVEERNTEIWESKLAYISLYEKNIHCISGIN